MDAVDFLYRKTLGKRKKQRNPFWMGMIWFT